MRRAVEGLDVALDGGRPTGCTVNGSARSPKTHRSPGHGQETVRPPIVPGRGGGVAGGPSESACAPRVKA